MKNRLIVTALSLLPLLSCTAIQEMEETRNPDIRSGKKVHLEFTVSSPKTSLGENDVILWEKGDAISIFDGVENCRFETKQSGEEVMFEGEARDAGSWLAVYPYNQSTEFVNNSVVTYIKSAQYSPKGSFGSSRSLSMCSVGKDKEIHFKNAFGLVEFKLSSSDITSVTISGNSGEDISGSLTMSLKNGEPKNEVTDGRSYVNILPENRETFEPGTYYAAINPTDFTSGFNLKFTRSKDDKYASISSDSRIELKRNAILPLGTVDASLDWSKTDITRVEVELRDSKKSYWPFATPAEAEISSSAQSPSFVNVKKTFTLDPEHGGHQFEFYAENGLFRVSSQNQGLKIMGGENDYILFPAIEGKRLSKVELRSGAAGFMRYPSIRTSDGKATVSGGEMISSGFDAEGDSYQFNLYDTEFGARYRLCFNAEGRNTDGSDAARIQKITLYYSALPGGDPKEEQEVFGLTEDQVPDFSRVGYHFGDDPIPDYPVSKTLTAPSGTISTAVDASAMIQKALDEALPRTAVLLKAGTYYIDKPINLKRSKVVLRGEGNSTILKARVKTPDGKPTEFVVSTAEADLSDSRMIRMGVLKDVANNRVLNRASARRIIKDAYCGQMFVCVAEASDFSVGDRVFIQRPGTRKWIHALHMDEIYPNGGETIQWDPVEFTLGWERTVMAVEGSRVYLDNPLVMSLTEEYGGGYIMKCSYDRISESGVENIVFDTDYNSSKTDDSSKYDYKWGTYKCDEEHCWNAIMIFAAEHCWVREVKARHMAGACVNFRSGSRNITAENCSNEDPISMIQGSRRYAFHFNKAELCLVKNCSASKDRHAFVTGSYCSGPNVFVKCSARNMYEDVGPHQKWATGCLYDNVSTDYWFTVQDRADAGSGHGWAGANFVLWNCDVVSRTDGLVPTAGRRIVVQSPWVSAKCWAYGCTGEKYSTTRNYKETPALGARPDGVWGNYGSHMSTESLYEQQLKDRHAAGINIWSGVPGIESYVRDVNEYF